ncbi:MAG: asparagine synthase (glutamine-hydrolyzing) [Clostridia bacterium]|nr:asparagine synthase (glutamine-hydrolyzing) [Lachnospiraceae bacterium]NCC00991.1 asparagine synthase (glutamine-hydrolyzing) [Clostridia bacterium]NCD03443.1 asparagine synthase (glutamine-hydrolyzing) [Clostridia bacterium]
MITVKTYKGHIRNWESLCGELGIDTSLSREDREKEILVKAYEAWGADMANHMHGMFAFALWDDSEDRLFCLRDQFGTTPFYYYETADGKLLYGSSIRAIMKQPGFVKELNEEMLQLYLSLTYVAGESTFFKGLFKLMPGRYLIWQDGRLKIERYWAPEFHPDESKSLEAWADEIHTTLQKIIPEVKTAGEKADSFLSGGVDSSYVLAMSDVEMTDSCGYDEERFDESGLAKLTADVLGRKNSRCLITPEAYFAEVPYVMYYMEQPLADASAIVFSLGCKATAEHAKICYSGEGADEFFGGYNMYRNAERYGENLKTFYVGNTNIMKEDEKRKILKNYDPDVLPIEVAEKIYEDMEGLDPLSKMSAVDIQIWLEGDIYLNVDKMSTAAGLEIRMPLTDTRIFDIASRMPSKYKVNGEQNKVAFRTAAAKVLPEEIAFRKKLGFIVPIRIWMADDRYNQDVRAKFKSDMAAKFFKLDEINAIFEEYIGGNSDNWRKIWTIYTFLVWYELYFVKNGL